MSPVAHLSHERSALSARRQALKELCLQPHHHLEASSASTRAASLYLSSCRAMQSSFGALPDRPQSQASQYLSPLPHKSQAQATPRKRQKRGSLVLGHPMYFKSKRCPYCPQANETRSFSARGEPHTCSYWDQWYKTGLQRERRKREAAELARIQAEETELQVIARSSIHGKGQGVKAGSFWSTR